MKPWTNHLQAVKPSPQSTFFVITYKKAFLQFNADQQEDAKRWVWLTTAQQATGYPSTYAAYDHCKECPIAPPAWVS